VTESAFAEKVSSRNPLPKGGGYSILNRKNIMDITDSNFKEIITSDKTVLVDFWAPWCGPCRAVSPILDQIAEEYFDKLTVVKLNIDENPEMTSLHGVSSIPTMKVFQNGEVVKTIVGAKPKPALLSELHSFLQ
jgi:thioredoxin 1